MSCTWLLAGRPVLATSAAAQMLPPAEQTAEVRCNRASIDECLLCNWPSFQICGQLQMRAMYQSPLSALRKYKAVQVVLYCYAKHFPSTHPT